MILRMESYLMRTSKMKGRRCCDMTESGSAIGPTKRLEDGSTQAILLEVVVLIRVAQEALLGMKPEILPPGSLASRKRILAVGLFHPLKGRHCQET